MEEIPNIRGKFDFVFMDALHTDNYKYLNLLRHRVIEGGAITTHDVISRARIMEDFLHAIENDPKNKRFLYLLPAGHWYDIDL